MRRRLLLVNLALVALAIGGLLWFRAEYRRAMERYRILSPATSAGPPRPAPAAPDRMSEAPELPPAQPAAFLDAAEKFLFSWDRNPTVVVEQPKVKPRPALPQLFGVMNIGGGPIAIMAAASNTPHKTIRVGEKIGEFKLLAAAEEQITLEWEGQTIQAQVSDLLVRAAPEARPSGGVAPLPAPASFSGATVINPNAASSERSGEYKIGPAMQGSAGTIYQSLPGDNAPGGAVYQGKRKVTRTTPFGTQSWWEDVK